MRKLLRTRLKGDLVYWLWFFWAFDSFDSFESCFFWAWVQLPFDSFESFIFILLDFDLSLSEFFTCPCGKQNKKPLWSFLLQFPISFYLLPLFPTNHHHKTLFWHVSLWSLTCGVTLVEFLPCFFWLPPWISYLWSLMTVSPLWTSFDLTLHAFDFDWLIGSLLIDWLVADLIWLRRIDWIWDPCDPSLALVTFFSYRQKYCLWVFLSLGLVFTWFYYYNLQQPIWAYQAYLDSLIRLDWSLSF